MQQNDVGHLDYWEQNGWKTVNHKRVRSVDLWSHILLFSVHLRSKTVHVSAVIPISVNSQALRKFLCNSIRTIRTQTTSPPTLLIVEVAVAEVAVHSVVTPQTNTIPFAFTHNTQYRILRYVMKNPSPSYTHVDIDTTVHYYTIHFLIQIHNIITVPVIITK